MGERDNVRVLQRLRRGSYPRITMHSWSLLRNFSSLETVGNFAYQFSWKSSSPNENESRIDTGGGNMKSVDGLTTEREKNRVIN